MNIQKSAKEWEEGEKSWENYFIARAELV